MLDRIPPHPSITSFVERRAARAGEWNTEPVIETLTPERVTSVELLDDEPGSTQLTWRAQVRTDNDRIVPYIIIDTYNQHGIDTPSAEPKYKSWFFTPTGSTAALSRNRRFDATVASKELGVPVPHHVSGPGWIASREITEDHHAQHAHVFKPNSTVDLNAIINDIAVMFLLGNVDVKRNHLFIHDDGHIFIDIEPMTVNQWISDATIGEQYTKHLFQHLGVGKSSARTRFLQQLVQYRFLSLCKTLQQCNNPGVKQFFEPIKDPVTHEQDLFDEISTDPDTVTIPSIARLRAQPFPTETAVPSNTSSRIRSVIFTDDLWTDVYDLQRTVLHRSDDTNASHNGTILDRIRNKFNRQL